MCTLYDIITYATGSLSGHQSPQLLGKTLFCPTNAIIAVKLKQLPPLVSPQAPGLFLFPFFYGWRFVLPHIPKQHEFRFEAYIPK